MLRTFKIPLTWSELIKCTLREASADNLLGIAAQLSYYFLLALVPTILCVVALASFMSPQVVQDVVTQLGRVAPGEVVAILRDQLQNVVNGQSTGVFTFGFLFAIWSSSAALVGIIEALNRAYDIEEGRPWWKVRLTAILLTIGVAVFVVAAFGLVMVGPTLADQLATRLGFGDAFALAWKILQWPVVFVLVVIGVGLVFYFAPDAEQQWEWITPGAVLGTILWLIASLGFKIYATSFAQYNETYGSLGGVIVLMLWFYVSSLAILIGAEMNAEIEHASPHGKDVGEKVPGEKKKLGALAARAYDEKQRMAPPPAKKRPQPDRPALGRPDATRRPSRWAALTAYTLIGADLVRALRQGDGAQATTIGERRSD